MKLEMTLQQRARRGVHLEDLTPRDRAEVDRFKEFLQHAKEPMPALVQRFGADYLGLSDAEVAAL